VDTHTAATVLFALPRNIQDAPFPAGSPAAAEFPDGFSRLLNAVYGYGVDHPQIAPAEPTDDPGANLLMSSISTMLGLNLHHYVMVDMAGLAAIVDALGGVTVDVGPVPLPIGGVTYSGRRVEPQGYLQPGVHHLNGFEALWFARSRRNSSDYDRMGRQRCLIQALVTQKSPTELLFRFRSVAAATTDSVSTSIPRTMLPELVSLVDEHFPPRLRTVSFDPNLPSPTAPDGTFEPASPDISYMREVVNNALAEPSPSPVAATSAADPNATKPPPTTPQATPAPATPTTSPTTPTPAPTTPAPVEPTCGATPVSGSG
jgi:LCP family protein required for cell wall assembly